MDHEYDPVVGFARAAETMAATQLLLAESQARIEQTTQYMAETQRHLLGTQRLGHAILAFQCVMLGLALVGLGYLIWLGFRHSAEHAALTQALIETLHRLPKP